MSDAFVPGDRPIRHHPSETTLVSYAGGALGRLFGLVVATHLTFCSRCRATTNLVDRVGGVLLERLPSVPLAPDALDRILARLDEPNESSSGTSELTNSSTQHPSGLPSSLDGVHVGRFRWLAPGIHFAELLRSGDALLGLLRIRAGVAIPLHGHRGPELTCVIAGAYRDETGVYSVGDFEETGEQAYHRPIAQGPGDCVCLVATHRRLRFATLISRLWQPFQPF